MPLEQYALGLEGSRDSFCYWMEWATPDMGSIRGDTSRKMIIYKKKRRPEWCFPREYADERQAWEAVRAGFVEAFARAKVGNLDQINDIDSIRPGSMLVLKTLHLYYPEAVLPIHARGHLRHYLRQLDRPEGDVALSALDLNQTLLSTLREVPELEGWTTQEAAHLLWSTMPPVKGR